MKINAKVICVPPVASDIERDDIAAARFSLASIKADAMMVVRHNKPADPEAMPDESDIDVYVQADSIPEAKFAEGIALLQQFMPMAMVMGIEPSVTLVNANGTENKLV